MIPLSVVFYSINKIKILGLLCLVHAVVGVFFHQPHILRTIFAIFYGQFLSNKALAANIGYRTSNSSTVCVSYFK